MERLNASLDNSCEEKVYPVDKNTEIHPLGLRKSHEHMVMIHIRLGCADKADPCILVDIHIGMESLSSQP